MLFGDLNFNSGENYRKDLLSETFIVMGWVFRSETYWDEIQKGRRMSKKTQSSSPVRTILREQANEFLEQ